MSDKSFGDSSSRNVMKNPLLSSAVTGLSIEDLTQNAVLLPVVQTQGLNNPQDHSDHQLRSQNAPLTHSSIELPNFPSGDANFTPTLLNSSATLQNLQDTQNIKNHQKNDENATISKATTKSEDDFDVNEYFARLHGTRYVSAPMNSLIEEDKNANLEATEENLEEINLNEPEKLQQDNQSITADIAQNFSQLPTVLPHVASAVYNSFSNMLNYKSREQTPEVKAPAYSETQTPKFEHVSVPLMGVDAVETPREVAPPPKEPPLTGIGNYRIASKKKYAQVPGLSTSQQPQNYPTNISNQMPSYFMPNQTPVTDVGIQDKTQIEDAKHFAAQPYIADNKAYNIFTPIQDVKDESRTNIFPDDETPKLNVNIESKCDVTYSQPEPKVALVNPQVPIPIIPPPPMFSNSQKRDQAVIEKSVLPPSVARRISANQSIMKPAQAVPKFMDNIFVPAPIPEAVPDTRSPFVNNEQVEVKSSIFSDQVSINNPIAGSTIPCYSIPADSNRQPTTDTQIVNVKKIQDLKSFEIQNLQKSTPNSQSIFPPILNKGEIDNIYEPPNAKNMPQIANNPPPLFFNTSSMQTHNIAVTLPEGNSQRVSEPPKPISEPPKSAGTINYRMTKKRPQYYSGPIEGFGSISNNVKPLLTPVQAGPPQSFSNLETTSTSLFTPSQVNIPEPQTTTYLHAGLAQESIFAPEYQTPSQNQVSLEQASVAFDITKSPNSALQFERNKPDQQIYTQIDTPFDTSRQTTDNVEQTQESKGFGIIGSLKSKLSSLDINKIQNTVTTFFDPTYNDTKQEIMGGPQQIDDKMENFDNKQDNIKSHGFLELIENQGTNFPTHNIESQYYPQSSQYTFDYQANPYYQPQGFFQSHVNVDYSNYCQGNIYPHTDYSPNVYAQEQSSVISQDDNGVNLHAVSSAGQMNDHSIMSNMISKIVEDIPDRLDTNKYGIPGLTDKASSDKSFFENKSSTFESLLKTIDIENKISDLQIGANDESENKDGSGERSNNNSFKSTETQKTIIESFEPSNVTNFFMPQPETNIWSKQQIDTDNEASHNLSRQLKDLSSNLNKTLYDKPQSDNQIESSIFGLSEDNKCNKNLLNLERNIKHFMLSDSDQNFVEDDTSMFFKDDSMERNPLLEDHDTDLDICETCREVNKPKEKETDDLTTQLIENITAPIQLLNPVEVPLTESNAEEEDTTSYDVQQCNEITRITEETIDTIHVQSALELVDDNDYNPSNSRNYEWFTEDTISAHTGNVILEHNYSNPDTSTVGFFGENNNSFFDNILRNTDEMKTELKNSQEEQLVLLPRQMSTPSAPPEESFEDTKFDEVGILDVQSIEQDAKKDFPVQEDYIIEKSDTDKYKIEVAPREVDIDTSEEIHNLTNREDKFEQIEKLNIDDSDQTMLQTLGLQNAISPTITIASYFDTGNYAAETHYKNSFTSPTSSSTFTFVSNNVSMRIPPGFENEYKKKLKQIQSLTTGTNLNDKSPANKDNTLTTQTRLSPTSTFSVCDKGSIETTETDLPDITKEINKNEPYIPDTTTQTHLTSTVTISSAQIKPINVTTRSQCSSSNYVTSQQIPDFDSVFGVFPKKSPDERAGNFGNKSPFNVELTKAEKITQVAQNTAQTAQSLPDPMNFFASSHENTQSTEDSGFNRLASYFTTPPKADPSKSFFELSQSQNHYRHKLEQNASKINSNKENCEYASIKIHKDVMEPQSNIPDDKYLDNLEIIKDLTSTAHFNPIDQQIRTVNYFSIEYDHHKPDINIGEPEKLTLDKVNSQSNFPNEIKETCNDTNSENIINQCVYCCNFNAKIIKIDSTIKTDIKIKKAMDNSTNEGKKLREEYVDPNKNSTRRSLSNVSLDTVEEESSDSPDTFANENRSGSEYEPVKHHWFYRFDSEGKSIWRGFSTVDSKILEQTFKSPDLTENTLVPTDGGRYDVNVVGRLRISVYWNEKPTNVRRCSWFYKGPTDPRYTPYTEIVAEKLEEEYQRGITTGEWHRRLMLNNNEIVVMHGPAVMVHFLHGTTDAFSSPNLFSFGKRVYRNPVKIRVAKDQPEQIDHLILFVHGAGEWKSQKEKIQSTSRPRVVRRGHDESEVEDPEPSRIDHLLLLCHGVGSACDMRFRSVEEVVDDFRATSLQLIQSHYRNSYDSGIVGRVEVLPISWHSTLHSGEAGVDRRLALLTLDSIPKLRNFTNDTVLDVLFYTSPIFCQTIIDTVCKELNRIYNLFRARNPSFSGGVSLGGHSLGSVILYDLLCNQKSTLSESSSSHSGKQYVGTNCSRAPVTRFPTLDFAPDALYALGSPIAIFECIRGVESLGADFELPTCKKFFNIFHPYDPIAYRIEPLINAELRNVKPFQIPHHKGRKRMHLELKDTMVRVGADLKQKLIESIRSTWTNMWKQSSNTSQLERVVEEEIEKQELAQDAKEEPAFENPPSEMLGKLNGGRRVDYVLQEAPFEMINEYLFAMSSHVCYWESEDTMLLMLREMYSARGVQPDCSLPQQTMSVERDRPVKEDSLYSSDDASTSRGGLL